MSIFSNLQFFRLDKFPAQVRVFAENKGAKFDKFGPETNCVISHYVIEEEDHSKVITKSLSRRIPIVTDMYLCDCLNDGFTQDLTNYRIVPIDNTRVCELRPRGHQLMHASIKLKYSRCDLYTGYFSRVFFLEKHGYLYDFEIEMNKEVFVNVDSHSIKKFIILDLVFADTNKRIGVKYSRREKKLWELPIKIKNVVKKDNKSVFFQFSISDLYDPRSLHNKKCRLVVSYLSPEVSRTCRFVVFSPEFRIFPSRGSRNIKYINPDEFSNDLCLQTPFRIVRIPVPYDPGDFLKENYEDARRETKRKSRSGRRRKKGGKRGRPKKKKKREIPVSDASDTSSSYSDSSSELEEVPIFRIPYNINDYRPPPPPPLPTKPKVVGSWYGDPIFINEKGQKFYSAVILDDKVMYKLNDYVYVDLRSRRLKPRIKKPKKTYRSLPPPPIPPRIIEKPTNNQNTEEEEEEEEDVIIIPQSKEDKKDLDFVPEEIRLPPIRKNPNPNQKRNIVLPSLEKTVLKSIDLRACWILQITRLVEFPISRDMMFVGRWLYRFTDLKELGFSNLLNNHRKTLGVPGLLEEREVFVSRDFHMASLERIRQKCIVSFEEYPNLLKNRYRYFKPHEFFFSFYFNRDFLVNRQPAIYAIPMKQVEEMKIQPLSNIYQQMMGPVAIPNNQEIIEIPDTPEKPKKIENEKVSNQEKVEIENVPPPPPPPEKPKEQVKPQEKEEEENSTKKRKREEVSKDQKNKEKVDEDERPPKKRKLT